MMSNPDLIETLSFPCLDSRGLISANPAFTFQRIIFDACPERPLPWAMSWFNPFVGLIHLPFSSGDPMNAEWQVLLHHEAEGHGPLINTPVKRIMHQLVWEIYTEIQDLAKGDLGENHLPYLENMPNMRSYHPVLQKIHDAVAPTEEFLAIYGGFRNLGCGPGPGFTSINRQRLLQESIKQWYLHFKRFPTISRLIPSSPEAMSLYIDIQELLNGQSERAKDLKWVAENLFNIVQGTQKSGQGIVATEGMEELLKVRQLYKGAGRSVKAVAESISTKIQELHSSPQLLSGLHRSQLGPYSFSKLSSALNDASALCLHSNYEFGVFANTICNYVSLLRPFNVKMLTLMDILIFFESMRQQLRTGIGLRCPYWTPDEGCVCKGSLIMEMLEGIWKHTDSKSYGWRLPPCLFPEEYPYSNG